MFLKGFSNLNESMIPFYGWHNSLMCATELTPKIFSIMKSCKTLIPYTGIHTPHQKFTMNGGEINYQVKT